MRKTGLALLVACLLVACSSGDSQPSGSDGGLIHQIDGPTQQDAAPPADGAAPADAAPRDAVPHDAAPPLDGSGECVCDTDPAFCETGCLCDPLCTDPTGCACDLNPTCDEGCACDTVCAAVCSCDTTWGCTEDCACDPECWTLTGPTSAACTTTVSTFPSTYDGQIDGSEPEWNGLPYDAYCVALTNGQTLTAETMAPASGEPLYDTVVHLFTATGQHLGMDDDLGQDRYSKLEYTVTADGTYVVVMLPYNQAILESGSYYQIRIDRQ